MKYTVVIREGNESGFVATVPALPGCVSQGCTTRAGLKNIKEAVAAFIESLVEDGLPVPRETSKQFVEIRVAAQ
jgi:predicted RNase H-like HicB family nuclease